VERRSAETETPVEEAHLESLVDASYPRILRAALVLTGNRWDADDLAQETFLQAMRSWRRFRGHSRVDTWLYAILLNLHRKRLRSVYRRRQGWLRWLRRAPARPEADPPGARIEWEEWRDSLWAAVARLPQAQQHAVVLRYSEGLTYAEVAEVLHCPIGTVKSRLHHGLAALGRNLAEQGATHAPRADVKSANG
jgi:RNA polymerase sigma-70 factor (ECF subfamily)